MQPTIAEMQGKKNEPFIASDSEGIILHINDLFEQTFQWQFADLVGKPLTSIIPGDLRDAHNLGFSRVALSGRSTLLNQPLVLKILTGDGMIIDAEHCIVSETAGDETIFGAHILPI